MSDQQKKRKPDPELGKEAEALGTAWSKLEQAEPPEMLDQAILNAARRDLGQRTRRARRGWLGALATAAVVVLALAITVRQDQQGPVPPVSKTDGLKYEQSAPASAETKAAAPAAPGDSRAEHIQARRPAPAAGAASAASQRDTDAGQPLAESIEEEAAPPDPELWVERLMRLHGSGRQQELEAELAAFRRTYPDYPLPQELLD